jgi:hypothetical protein
MGWSQLRRNYVLNHDTEGKIEATGRRGRRRTQILDDLKKTKRYWKLKDRNLWRTRSGRDRLRCDDT